MAGKSHARPTAIEVGKRGKNLDAKGGPASPSDALEGAMVEGKKGTVARLGGILVVH